MHAPGVDADRILLVGSGGTVGYGVLSHDLGVAGHIARRVSELTGRGTDLDVIASPAMSAAGAQATISSAKLARYDLVMITVGGFEALQLTPPSKRRHQLAALFDSVIAAAPASLSIVIVGVATMPSIINMPPRFAPLVVRAGERMNDQTVALAATRPQVTFAPFQPRAGHFPDTAGSDIYSEWSALVAPVVAIALDAHAARPTDPVDEEARLHALRELTFDDRGPDERIDRIVANARDLFGTSGAALNFIDSEESWAKAAVGMPRESSPRSTAVCATTILTPSVLVIEDTAMDARFSSLATGDDPVRFYAGYPLEAPDGHRVGALCIVDTAPRAFTGSDASLLRDLALRVQALLWENLERRATRARAPHL